MPLTETFRRCWSKCGTRHTNNLHTGPLPSWLMKVCLNLNSPARICVPQGNHQAFNMHDFQTMNILYVMEEFIGQVMDYIADWLVHQGLEKLLEFLVCNQSLEIQMTMAWQPCWMTEHFVLSSNMVAMS